MKTNVENKRKKVPTLSEEENKKLEELGSFLDIIIRRLEDIKYLSTEIKDFIETDSYAKENAEKFKLFFDDLKKLDDMTEHIYDNMPLD